MIAPDRLSDLASRFWEAGSLSAEEERDLGQALKDSPEARRLVGSYLRLEGAILQQARAGQLSQIPAQRASAPVKNIRSPWLPWVAGLAAAGFVIVMILTARSSSPAPTPTRVARSPHLPSSSSAAPAENPRVAEAPAPTPIAPPPGPPPATAAPEPAAPPPTEPQQVPVLEPALATRPAEEKEAVASEIVLERTEGDVFVTGGGARKAGRTGDPIRPGQAVETSGGKSLAVLAFPDGTRVEVRPDTLIREVRDKSAKAGKALTIQHGAIWAQVRPQPAERPLVLLFPRGEARVLGTVFTLQVDADPKGLTRLDVQEGKVRFTRSSDNRSVEVVAGHSASSGQGAELLLLRSQDVVQSFQDGRFPAADYAGTQDTTLAEKSPLANYGAARTLAIEAEDAREKRKASWSLLRWDLTSLPPGSIVRSAQITLHVLEPSHGQPFYFFEPARGWTEKEASWKFAASGTLWRFPGSLGANERWPQPLGTLAPLQKGEYTAMLGDAGVALVQSWINAPAGNLGLQLASAVPGAELRLSSREAPSPEHRPRLTVVTTPKK